ncbi:MAG: hypothetical protein H8D23_37500, partial [Candidatus Brocadiales bacterium]|nr:hypothetical protein [Candidatus Brocadiales bacterium]
FADFKKASEKFVEDIARAGAARYNGYGFKIVQAAGSELFDVQITSPEGVRSISNSTPLPLKDAHTEARRQLSNIRVNEQKQAIEQPKQTKAEFSPENLLAEFDKAAGTVTAKEKLEETKQHLANAADKIKQMNAILGSRGSFSTEKVDENIYAQLKPLMQGALNDILMAGKSAAEYAKLIVETLSPKGRIYFERFVKNDMVVDEKLNPGYNSGKDKEAKKNGDADNIGRPDISETAKDNDRSGDKSKSPEDVSKSEEGQDADAISDTTGSDVDGGLRAGETPSPDGITDKSTGKRKSPKRSTDNGDGSLRKLEGDSGELSGVQRRGKDHRITPGSIDRTGSWKKTAGDNLDAIVLYKKIVSENRPATPAEQKILAKYVGWGASELANKMFPGYAQHKEVMVSWANSEWKDSVKRLIEVLTPEEIKTAAKSTQYAHYTSEKVISSIYKALGNMGFTGGKILEPGMGIGNFIGLLPQKMAGNSTYTGIEMDHVSAGIAKLLYPNQNVIQADFTKQSLPKNFFDAAIGNPPFGDIKILADPEYAKQSFSLHNYFFAKAIDRVRPGGLLVFVTSRYTMDAQKDRARKYIGERADLLGAIRLPQTAFKQNAGTEVVTDVLFFKKREEGAEPSKVKWAGTTAITLDDSRGNSKDVQINEYFAAHPEMILGQNSLAGSMYSANEYTVTPLDGDIEEHFLKAIKKLPKNIYSNTTEKDNAVHNAEEIIERDFNPENKKEGGVYIGKDGKTLMQVNFGSGVALNTVAKLSPNDKAILTDYLGLRDRVKLSHQAQLKNGDWESALKDLNTEYKKFVKKHGNILEYKSVWKKVENEDGTIEKVEVRKYVKEKIFRNDAEYTLVWALEKITDDGDIVASSILKDRTIMRPVTPIIKTVPDALAVSLNNLGKLDIDHVAKLAEKPVKEVLEVLGDLIYKSPEGESYILADEYLSGDVVTKLDEAV